MSHMRRTGKRKQYAQSMREIRASMGRVYRKQRKAEKRIKRAMG